MEMETTWSDLCRCCLSAESEVSLLDADEKTREKFQEITTIQVCPDDGLPQKLCSECYTLMLSAYQFRKQCIKMDIELRLQLNSILSQTKDKTIDDLIQETVNCELEPTDEDIANDALKQLEAIIKKEPSDGDDDYYYVVVVDDPKDKEVKGSDAQIQISVKNELESNEPHEDVHMTEVTDAPHSQTHFEKTFDGFLMSNTTVPVNVPANILQNEDEYQENVLETMNIEEIQNSVSQDEHLQQIPEYGVQGIIETMSQGTNQEPENVIKIMTSTDSDGTILLRSNDGVEYLTDTQLVTHENEGDTMDQEVILCEGDESSQFQIVKYEGSELVIEYADDGQIATVLQQEDGTFLCDCGEQFEDLAEYEKHQYKHSPAGESMCNLCGKGFESPEILVGHMLLHKFASVMINCPYCDQLIKRTSITNHIKYSHNNYKPQCDICFKTFANPNNLKRHMVIHSGIREFECDICFKRFSQKITMQTHRMKHVNPYFCNYCDSEFDNKAALTEHKESGKCSRSTVIKVKDELMKTIKQEVTTNNGKFLGYACTLCNKMFSVESALEQHVETAHIVDPTELLCSECGEVLPSRKDMETHLLAHKNAKSKNSKKFECSICGKSCPSQAMLLMHERVHTNERPFPCEHCTLWFKTKTHLRTHQLTHTREKKFGCSICMKFFSLKGNLIVHLRTHTGERPYVCSLCNEAFIDSKYLKKHKIKKHAIENVPWNQY